MTNIRNNKIIGAFGERLQWLRLNKGIPREELAVKADISTGQIGRIERGEINTTLSTIAALASALEIDLKDLLDFSMVPNEKAKLGSPKGVIKIFKEKLGKAGIHHKINKKGGYFEVWLDSKGRGILVSNLGENNLLEWKVFIETIALLNASGGKADKGNAMAYKLGEPGLSTKTIEGHLAKTIYKRKDGESVQRRITPISTLLEWAGVCKSIKGHLVLIK